jgi:hypothetical protein
MNTIKVHPEYLYHTTTIYNEKSKKSWKEDVEESLPYLPYPEWNSFHSILHPIKFFTITPYCDYSSPSLGRDEVYLKYKLNKPITLLDNRDDVYGLEEILNILQRNQGEIDGYIGLEDCVEIMLYTPSNFVDKEFEIIQFQKYEHDHEYEFTYLNLTD